MRQDIKTVYISMGEKCSIDLLGSVLPYLAGMYPDHTLTINTNKVFSSKNGLGEFIIVCWEGNSDDFDVYNLFDIIELDREIGPHDNVTMH
jgi:hypothetical protein